MTLHGPGFGPNEDEDFRETARRTRPTPALDFSADQRNALDYLRDWLGPIGSPTAAAFVPTGERDDLGLAVKRRADYGRANPKSPLATLGGFAGTGKSTLTGYLIREWIDAGLSIACATYTGKASLILNRALERAGAHPAYVGTIHRLVYQPDIGSDGELRVWRKQDRIPYDVLIVDEASMVPTPVLDDLLAYNVPIVAVGDHGQLPPVGEDADAALMAHPHVTLTRIHRQALGNPIIALSAAVREGKAMQEIRYAVDAVNAAGETRVRYMQGRPGLEEALRFTADPNSMIICHTNTTRIAMNIAARKARGFDPKSPPQVGESVICLRNNYGLTDSNGVHGLVANGARGVLDDCAQPQKNAGFHSLSFTLEDGRVFRDAKALAAQFGRLPFARYREVAEAGGPKLFSWEQAGLLADFGYCLTCHKAQGSQADRVVVIVEKSLSVLSDDERKRWLYTAITRSASELLLVSL